MDDKITIILNNKKIILDSLTSHVLKEQFKNIFVTNFINLDILNDSTKVILLDRISSLMANSAHIIYDDEFLGTIPNGREVHNDLFNMVKLTGSMIEFKQKTNGNVDEYKLKKLPELIINIDEYMGYMKTLDSNTKEK